MTFDVVDPATEEVVRTVPSTSEEETDEAIARAVVVQREWRRLAPADRGRLLRAFAEAVDAVVLKPAELTPLTAVRLGELALDAGLPEHLFQVLPGKGSVVGAAQVKRVTLELGGKSAKSCSPPPTSRRPRRPRRTASSTTPSRTAARVRASWCSATSSTASWSCWNPRYGAYGLPDDTEYGLSRSIWTNDVSRALRVSRAVEAGNLSVNAHSSVRHSTPFGGFKQSGLGRELGPDALDPFTEVKNVFIATEDA